MEAEKTAPEIAREAVALIDALFAVERQGKDASVAERLELRQKQSVPILAELHRKLLIWKEQLLPKHPMADAVDYTLGQWEALTVFTTDGTVPIDNNVSHAASGMTNRMPRTRLCRVSRGDRVFRKESGCASLGRAA